MVTFDDVQNNPEIQALIREAGHVLSVMNYTEHGLRHVSYVSRTAHMILTKLGYDEKTCELAKLGDWSQGCLRNGLCLKRACRFRYVL